jgi:hypothetical protein
MPSVADQVSALEPGATSYAPRSPPQAHHRRAPMKALQLEHRVSDLIATNRQFARAEPGELKARPA